MSNLIWKWSSLDRLFYLLSDTRSCCIPYLSLAGTRHKPAHRKGTDVERWNISGWRRMIVINAEVRAEGWAVKRGVCLRTGDLCWVCRVCWVTENSIGTSEQSSHCRASTSRNISLRSNEHKSVTSLINRIRAHRQRLLFYRHPLTWNCQAAAWSTQIPPKIFAPFWHFSHLRFTRHCFICIAIYWNLMLHKLQTSCLPVMPLHLLLHKIMIA